MKKRCFSFMHSGSLFSVYGGKLTGFWCTLVLLLMGAVSAVNSVSLVCTDHASNCGWRVSQPGTEVRWDGLGVGKE